MVESDVSDESEETEEGDDDVADRHQLENALKATVESDADPNADGRRSQTPTKTRSGKQVPASKPDSARTASPKPKKTTAMASPAPAKRKTTPSPRRSARAPAPEEEEESEGSYSEDEEDEEVRRLGGTGDHEEAESDHDYVDDEDEGEAAAVNARTQELRSKTYPPGTQFVVTQDFTGTQTGDLTIQRGEIVTLVEQRPDDWWLCKSNQTQQQGVVPINHLQLLPKAPRIRAKPSTSATNLVEAFKSNNSIPLGFTASDLAPLTQLEEYKLSRALVPKMTDSNLSFTDLHWRVENDRLHIHDVTYQKILTLKECVKIPRTKGDQVN